MSFLIFLSDTIDTGFAQMNVLIVPDKFKGSLSAQQVCDSIEEGLHTVDHSLQVTKMPMADGGEGSSELLTRYARGSAISLPVRDPLLRTITATYGVSSDGKSAFMEIAQASGLQLLAKSERNPMLTTTAGTGDMIRHAIENGIDKIMLGIGGSATNDGGMGMMQALGVRFLDRHGKELTGIGSNLAFVAKIDSTHVHPRLKETKFVIFCDVDNPLHGPNGAAYVFSPQKGASPDDVRILDAGLRNFQNILENHAGVNVDFAGAGAGGGLPSSLKAFTQLTIRGGMEFIIEFTHLDKHISACDVVVTGEGKVDTQTLSGKVVKGVADLAAKYHKPLIVVAGISELSTEQLRSMGVVALVALTDGETTEAEAMSNAYHVVASRIANRWESLRQEI